MCMRRDVHWVNFDKYIDKNNKKNSLQQGIRPAIIIQNNKGNQFSPTVIVVPITSEIKSMYLPTHVPISKGESGLKKDSIALTEQVRTISKSDLTKDSYIGRISEEKMNEIDDALEVSIGLQKKNNKNQLLIDLPYVRDMINTIKESKREYEIYNSISAKRIAESCSVRLKNFCKENNIDIKLLERQIRNSETYQLKKASC